MKHYWTQRRNWIILLCNKLHSHTIPVKAIAAFLSISKDFGFCLSINSDGIIIQIIYGNIASSQNGA